MKEKLITIVLTIIIIAVPMAIMPGKYYNLPKIVILLAGRIAIVNIIFK